MSLIGSTVVQNYQNLQWKLLASAKKVRVAFSKM